jgi:hypothetical protein
MVSEHASPLAVLGGVDAGGQNVHVARLAEGMGRHGVDVVVHTRRDDVSLPRRVRMSTGVTVDHVMAGPPTRCPRTTCCRTWTTSRGPAPAVVRCSAPTSCTRTSG